MRQLYNLESADEIFQEQNPKDENGNDTEDDDAGTEPKVQVKEDAGTEPKVQVKEECFVID
jgi:hypothetical protein